MGKREEDAARQRHMEVYHSHGGVNRYPIGLGGGGIYGGCEEVESDADYWEYDNGALILMDGNQYLINKQNL